MRRYVAAALFGSILALGSGAAPSLAQQRDQVAALTTQDSADIARVEDYLNRIDTMETRFVQVSSNGSYAEGTLTLDRPSRLRFDYDEPNPILMIADGYVFLYYDRELEQASQIPLWETPLWFLLREKVSLRNGLEILGVDRGPGTLTIRARQQDAPDQGQVALVFSDRPLQLLRWEIVDGRGVATQVALVAPRFGVAVDRDIFNWSDLPGAGLQQRNH